MIRFLRLHLVGRRLAWLMAAAVLVLFPAIGFLEAEAFLCGDSDGNNTVDVGDVIHIVSHIFRGGPAPDFAWAADVNCDGCINIADAVHVVNYVFKGGPAPCVACPDITQQILFEMNYYNFAWTPTLRGFYVDRDGNVYSYAYEPDGVTYDMTNPWWQTFTEAQLLDRYSHNPALMSTIDPDTLYEKYLLIQPAHAGTLSSPMVRCFDFGIAYYVAYTFDPLSGTYTPVLLRQMGDVAQTNFSPEAKALFEWMRSLEGGGDDLCDYPEK